MPAPLRAAGVHGELHSLVFFGGDVSFLVTTRSDDLKTIRLVERAHSKESVRVRTMSIILAAICAASGRSGTSGSTMRPAACLMP